MSRKIRPSHAGDESSFVAIKDQLPIQRSDGSSTTGGFLLGTDAGTYRQYIEQSHCLSALVNDQLVGFGIALPDAQLRASEVWEKRNSARLFVDLNIYEQQQLCYFEQLAFLPGHRRMVIALAYQLIQQAFRAGATAMLTTTVREPVVNLAAVPFIQAADGILAGNINEYYPGIGHINSDIWIIEHAAFEVAVRQHALWPFLRNLKETGI